MSKDVVNLEKVNDVVEEDIIDEINVIEVVDNSEFFKTGIYIHQFKKPFTYEGKTYETMTFDFNKLTGRDMINFNNEMTMNNEVMMAAEISVGFQSRMAAKASGIGLDVLERMQIKDFNNIIMRARLFLTSTVL